MAYLLIIEGDTNDADYISEATTIEDKDADKKLPLIRKVAKLMSEGHNWNSSEYADQGEDTESVYVATGLLTEAEVEEFTDYVPYGENGVHSLSSITLHKVISTEELL